jgi:hypothetical protein
MTAPMGQGFIMDRWGDGDGLQLTQNAGGSHRDDKSNVFGKHRCYLRPSPLPPPRGGCEPPTAVLAADSKF